MRAWLLIPALLFLLALLLRVSTVVLPVDGEPARLASIAEYVGAERGWVPEEAPPVMPLIVGAVISTGASPTAALRWVDLLLGCLVAPLGWSLARRLRCAPATAVWIGAGLAIHPFLVVNAGGVLPRHDALGLCLLLLALGALATASPRRRRGGAALAILLGLGHPAGPLYMVPLLVAYALREPGPRWQMILPGVALLALLGGPIQPLEAAGTPGTIWDLLRWLPVAGFGILWLGVPLGLAQLLRPKVPPPEDRGADPKAIRILLFAWGTAGLLHVGCMLLLGLGGSLGWDLDQAGAGALLVPLVVLPGMVGLAVLMERRPRWNVGLRWGRRVIGALALILAFYLGAGPVQTAVFPTNPARAGRLSWLRDAVAKAAEIAGPRGWIVLGVADDEPATQCSLADGLPDRVLTRRAPLQQEPEEDGLRVLLPFPAGAYPADQSFAMIVPAPRRTDVAVWSRVTTFTGEAIFEQEPVARVGAYLLLRVRGTMATDQD